VAEALTSRGYDVIAQYPACGFNIDLVVSIDGARLAVECDGELFHNDVHGQLRTEDLERQAILERAGWDLLRIAYRNWRRNREAELDRIDAWFSGSDEDEDYDADTAWENLSEPAGPPQSKNGQLRLSDVEAKILEVVGHEHDEERVLKLVREGLGYRALGKNIRALILQGADLLSHKTLVIREDGEWFPTSKVKESGQIVVSHKLTQPTARKRSYRGYRRSGSYYRRRW